MKKIYLIVGMWAALFSAKAQKTATFGEIDLQPDSFFNGSDGAGGFQSGGIWFPNSYNSEYNYWSGFSVSNMKDTTIAGYENQYSSITAGGVDNSENYAVVYAPAELKLQFYEPAKVEGFYVTNSVYAYLSMKNGDDWTKKFGGIDGSDPDYFRLLVSGKDALGNVTDTVVFYLADFRSGNSDEDYIVNHWRWFNLSSLGVVSELNFNVESTDVSEWGMNTPAYFCIDNFTIQDIVSHSLLLTGFNEELKLYPNPVKDQFHVEVPESVKEFTLIDRTGTIIWKNNLAGKEIYTISALSDMSPGIYFLQITTKTGVTLQKIIKY